MRHISPIFILAVMLFCISGCEADVPQHPPSAIAVSIHRAITWLAQQQKPNGMWTDPSGKDSIGLSALCVLTLSRYMQAYPEQNNFSSHIASACQRLAIYCDTEHFLHKEFWFFTGYEIPLTALALWHHDPQTHDHTINKLMAFMEKNQLQNGAPLYKADRPWETGGWNYSTIIDKNPDISIVVLSLEAITTIRPKTMTKMIKRALPYILRCQNRTATNTETNTLNDFGFKHAPFGGKAGYHKVKKNTYAFNSYGSATSDGIRALLYCGKTLNDPEVKDGMKWLRKHYVIDANPQIPMNSGYPQNTCLYYYYQSVAKLLTQPNIVFARPLTELRSELQAHIIQLQHRNGFWVNPSGAMWENYAPLATCYMINALLTLNNK